MAALIKISTTDNLTRQQKQDAGLLSSYLNDSFQPSSELKKASIHLRPAIPGFSDQLIYFPKDRSVLAYWSVTDEDYLEGALSALIMKLPLLQLSENPLCKALENLKSNGIPARRQEVQAYWSSPYFGGPSWYIRMQLLPEWYAQWQAGPLADFLNHYAPVTEEYPGLPSILLTYQAFQHDAHPDKGLFHYLPEGHRLIINVPLPIKDLPRLVQPPSTQRYALSAMLLSFLYLQRDPGIPGLEFQPWRQKLEQVFREEGFWEGVRP
ncbi:MAG: hypothetical protein H6558_18635 [Lewinellaceae bacterium]|nr:hypothetical protein [Lewinellaceae bacterium]